MPSVKFATALLQWLDALEVHDELPFGWPGYNPSVRVQLLQMSATTIHRYLKAERDRPQLKGTSTSKPGALLRDSIIARKAGDEVDADADAEPEFFETDTVAHCGPTSEGRIRKKP